MFSLTIKPPFLSQAKERAASSSAEFVKTENNGTFQATERPGVKDTANMVVRSLAAINSSLAQQNTKELGGGCYKVVVATK